MQPVTEGNEFCIFCGTKLPGGGSVGSDVSTGKAGSVTKKCRNGHTYDDPELVFCPQCGLRFDSKPIFDLVMWPCGHVNRSTEMFCTECGKRRDGKEPSVIPAVKIEPEKPSFIPAGMWHATEDDLAKK